MSVYTPGNLSGLTQQSLSANGIAQQNAYVLATNNITVTLPTAPPNGTVVVVKNNNVNTANHIVTVAAGGTDTIEGVASTVLRCSGYTGEYIYSAGIWTIEYTDPTFFPISFALTYAAFPAGTNVPSGTLLVPRTGNTQNNLSRPQGLFTTSFPYTIAAGAGNGLQPLISTPTCSGGSLTLRETDILISNAGGTQKMWLQFFPTGVISFGLTSQVPSGSVNGWPLLSSYTVLQSLGTDLAVAAGGLTVDSTAGGVFYMQVQTSWTVAGLIP